MNHTNNSKLKCHCCCEENKQFYLYRFKAKPYIIPPPPIAPIPITGTIIPSVSRYFYIVTDDIDLTNGFIISANNFYDDNGNFVNDIVVHNPNGYINLFINGVMQEGGIFSVNPSALVLNPNNGTIYKGTPIILESLGFTLSSIWVFERRWKNGSFYY